MRLKVLMYMQVHTNEYTDFNEFERDRRRVHTSFLEHLYSQFCTLCGFLGSKGCKVKRLLE